MLSSNKWIGWALTLCFLAIVFGVGLSQAGIELARREAPQFLDLFRQPPNQANLRTFESDLEKASWYAGQLRPWTQYAEFATLGDMGEKALLGREGWLFYKPGTQYLIQPSPALDEAVSAITTFKDRLAERGIQLLLVPAPGKASIYPEMLTARAEGTQRPLNTHTTRLMQALRDKGVAMADLFEAFSTPTEVPLYLAQDTHWSPAGMQQAAQTVASLLLEQGWVSKGNVSFDVKSVEVERHGDVIEMVQTPQIAKGFDPEHIECLQVLQPSGEPYQDSPDSPILVLGDSFLRIYERDEPGSAGFIAHLARELAMPLTSIVNDGGASTLVRQELYRKPELLEGKKVVIWEFVERDIRFGTEGWQDVPLPEAG